MTQHPSTTDARQSVRLKDRKASRLNELIVIATRFFNRQGMLSTRMEEIAGAAGMTPGNLYRYVKSKEELAYLCYLKSCEVRRAQLQIADDASLSGRARIEKFFRQLIREGQSRTSVLGEVGALKPAWAEKIDRFQRANTKALERIVSVGVADHSLRQSDPFLTTMGLVGVVEWISYWYTKRLAYAPGEVTDAMLDIVMSGVTAHRPYDVKGVRKLTQPDMRRQIAEPFDKDAMTELKLQSFLRAAMDAFNRDGVKATSIEKLAKQLKVTKGAFYHYFSSKEDLLFHCYQRAIEYHKDVISVAPADDNEHEVLVRRSLFERHISEMGPFPVYTNVQALEGTHHQQVMGQLADKRLSDKDRIERGTAAGDFRQVDSFIAEKVRAGLMNWFPIWYTTDRFTPTEVADNHSEIFLNGIANDG